MILLILNILYILENSNAQINSYGSTKSPSDIVIKYEKSELYNNPNIINFTHFKSLDHGIDLIYPNNWSIMKSENNIKNNYRVLTLTTLPEFYNDVQEQLRLHIFPSYYYKSLEEGLRVKSELPNLIITEPFKEISIGKLKLGSLIYTYSDYKYKEAAVLKIGFIHNYKFYIFYYFAQRAEFYDYLPTIKAIIESISFDKTKLYENFDMGIQMPYIPSWKVHEQTTMSGLGLQNKTIFNLEPNNTLFNNKLEIGIEVVKPYINLKEFGLRKIEDFSTDSSLYNNFTLLLTKDIFKETNFTSKLSLSNLSHNIFNETSTFLFSYTFPPNKKYYGFLTFGKTILSDKIYSILFTSEIEKFHHYFPQILESISSLRTFELLSYENFDMGMKLKYPSYWTYQNGTGTETSILTYVDDIIFYPKNRQNSSSYPEIKIFSFYNKNNTVDNMIEKQINYYKTRNNKYHDLSILASNHNSRLLNFSYYPNDIDPLIIKCSELITSTITEKKEYHIQYCAEKEKYSDHLPVVNTIIKSLQTFSVLRYEKNLQNEGGLLLEYPSSWNKIESFSSDENISLKKINNPSIHINIFSPNRSITNLESFYKTIYENNNFDVIQKELINIYSTKGKPIPSNKVTFKYVFFDNSKLVSIYGIHLSLKFNNYIYSVWCYSKYDTILSSAKIMLNSIKILDSYKKSHTVFSNYTDPTMSFDIPIPVDWSITFNDFDELQLNTPLFENSSEIDYDSSIYIRNIRDSNILGKTISEIVGNDLSLKHDPDYLLPDEIIEIKDIGKSSENSSAYSSEYISRSSLGHYHYLDTYIVGKNNSLFYVQYSSLDKYYNYLPIVNHIINSIYLKNTSQSNIQLGFNVEGRPTGIAYNANTNLIYITNSDSDSVSVIDAGNFHKKKSIRVGKNPDAIAVDPSINYIYVANLDSDSISIIDGTQNKEIRSIKVGPLPSTLAVNTLTHKVYVIDEDNTNLYVIDGPNDLKPDIIPTYGNDLDSGIGVTVNEVTNQVYVVNPYTQYVTIIEGETNDMIKNISMSSPFPDPDLRPFAITINPFTNHAYILSIESTLYELYLSSLNLNNYEIFNQKLGEDFLPLILDLNEITNMIYVPMSVNNSLAIIEPTDTNFTIKSIITDSYPYDVAIDKKQDIIYVTNYLSNTVSVINGTNNRNMFGIEYIIDTDIINYNILGFNIPLNSTKDAILYCNGERFVNNTFKFYTSGTPIQCLAKSELNGRSTPIVSSLWYEQNNPKHNTNPITFVVTEHGKVTGKFSDLGNFIKLASPVISLFVLVSVVIIFLSPSLFGKIRYKNELLFIDKRQKELLSKTEIIGIDGSIIVGILFFLTVTEGFEQHEQNEITLITASVIFPFALSVIMAIINRENLATKLTLAGFINLIISIILIVIMKVFT
jgi:YVTN family beta-propeller protein